MRLAGYEPLTLIDYPEHVASIVFTQGCVFRCVYCHNPELLPIVGEIGLTEEYILEQIKKNAVMLDGVVITGGEPTLHPDLPNFLKKIKSLGLKTKLDTNGVNPRMIAHCIKEKLVDFLAMDIKHRFDNYTEIIGLTPQVTINNCQQTLQLIQGSGVDHEFRTTVYPDIHTVDDIIAIATLLLSQESYTLQPIRFQKTLVKNLAQKETMDFDRLILKLRELFPLLNIQLKG